MRDFYCTLCEKVLTYMPLIRTETRMRADEPMQTCYAAYCPSCQTRICTLTPRDLRELGYETGGDIKKDFMKEPPSTQKTIHMPPLKFNREIEFAKFVVEEVLPHIKDYTIAQYGDAPDDQVESWSSEQCMKQIGKYVGRFGTNQRGSEDTLRDIKKIAHYAAMAFYKYLKEHTSSGPE